ncbi:LEA type 2 family protein [Chitiniphilus purpureus]|uniref:LEA type 2 family protein n=1 Tax=Chitiniphilus purpureus TaxID=2981137 RepID=A0ABY6DQM4_9NEIS|nr:LEA type 2 family protein [Chitiniphilus sp. CD1]UXY16665.1 LEA type 2 family protein [Chitiniphilus sp. CD1]
MRRRLYMWMVAGMVAWLAGCAGVPAHFEKPTVSLAGLSLKEAGLFEQRFTLVLRVQNPNRFALPLNGLDADLAVNGKPLASGVAAQAVTVPALGDAKVRIDVVSNLATLARQLRRADGQGLPRYRLTGRLFVPMRSEGIAFEMDGEVPAIEGWFDAPARQERF